MEKFTTVSSQEKGSQDQAVNSGEACANTLQWRETEEARTEPAA